MHSATAVTFVKGLTEVTLFGGKDENGDMLSDTTVLRFGEYHALCILVIPHPYITVWSEQSHIIR